MPFEDRDYPPAGNGIGVVLWLVIAAVALVVLLAVWG